MASLTAYSSGQEKRTRNVSSAWKSGRAYESREKLIEEIKFRSQLPQYTNFQNLLELLYEIGAQESDFLLSEILPKIESLAKELPDEEPKKLIAGKNAEHKMTKLHIAQILANAFFCTIDNAENYPDINFNRLYSKDSRSNYQKKEKLKCLLTYFKLLNIEEAKNDFVTFKRVCVDPKGLNWSSFSQPLCPVIINKNGNMYDCDQDVAQVDFANEFVGGGVLGNGCLQEEIKFATCPELIAARLITERLEDNEALLVQGARPYSTSTGYADSFKYTGEADINAKCSDTLLAIDATNYRYDYRMQYTKENIDREILKAYAGFSECPLQKIATGNWGGGAFMGDAALKFYIQWIAASKAGKELQYYCYGRDDIAKAVKEIYSQKWMSLDILYNYVISKGSGSPFPSSATQGNQDYTELEHQTPAVEYDSRVDSNSVAVPANDNKQIQDQEHSSDPVENFKMDQEDKDSIKVNGTPAVETEEDHEEEGKRKNGGGGIKYPALNAVDEFDNLNVVRNVDVEDML